MAARGGAALAASRKKTADAAMRKLVI